MSKIAKTESSNKHNWKVLDLDMFDLMELSDEGVIDSKLFDETNIIPLSVDWPAFPSACIRGSCEIWINGFLIL